MQCVYHVRRVALRRYRPSSSLWPLQCYRYRRGSVRRKAGKQALKDTKQAQRAANIEGHETSAASIEGYETKVGRTRNERRRGNKPMKTCVPIETWSLVERMSQATYRTHKDTNTYMHEHNSRCKNSKRRI